MEKLEFKEVHRPHDCRHTFATLMDNANANKTNYEIGKNENIHRFSR